MLVMTIGAGSARVAGPVEELIIALRHGVSAENSVRRRVDVTTLALRATELARGTAYAKERSRADVRAQELGIGLTA